ncbi:MAG TPA: hypothetical protein VM123_18330 [archaeon]|nr:hypothetical protein [archaeon]
MYTFREKMSRAAVFRTMRAALFLSLCALLSVSSAAFARTKSVLQTPGSLYRNYCYWPERFDRRSSLPCFRNSRAVVCPAQNCRTSVYRQASMFTTSATCWSSEQYFNQRSGSTIGQKTSYGRTTRISSKERIISYTEYRSRRAFSGFTIGSR